MAKESTPGTSGDAQGQPENAPETASAPAPNAIQGQPGESQTTTTTGKSGSGSGTDDVIFDPATYEQLTKNLPPELQSQANALKKQLQSDYTKKTQGVSDIKKKAAFWDEVNRDPHGVIRTMAERLGYELNQRGAKPKANAEGWTPDAGDPKSWQDVTNYILSQMNTQLGSTLKPVISEFQTARKTAIENQLSEIDPGWRQYEDVMMENLQKHPTLARDAPMLYRLSVPQDVIESRVIQRKLKSMENQVKGSRVAGTSTTTRQPATGLPDKPVSFAEAARLAEAQLEEQGIRKGA